ncbi:MAG: EutN/CcmL family microcompartment protein [Oligoflexia bacterium]|nr:EutN/CcmL family microcompartment protein [Oligoflexia bacterium]
MILAKVLEPVVCTIKDENFNNKKIFVVQPVDENLKPKGHTFLAFDSIQTGPGDYVIVCREGNGCRQLWSQDQAPVNAVIAGIVDKVDSN